MSIFFFKASTLISFKIQEYRSKQASQQQQKESQYHEPTPTVIKPALTSVNTKASIEVMLG
jgi:hypothetical protein